MQDHQPCASCTTSWYQYTQQQDDCIDEEHADGFRDGDIERTNLLTSHLLYNLVGIRLCVTVFNYEIKWSGTVAVNVSLFRELATADTCQPVELFTMTGR